MPEHDETYRDSPVSAGGFGGEIADLYAQFRRGYPPMFIDALAAALHLSPQDTIVDLGCGGGQLTIPMAGRVARAIGVDPEPAMVEHARQAARHTAHTNLQWIIGTAADLGLVAEAVGGVDAITVANAIHLIDRTALFSVAQQVLRPGGAIGIIANGVPLWLHDVPWSGRLRGFLEEWLATSVTDPCGTDAASRSVYREELSSQGYTTTEVHVSYEDTLTVEQIVGGCLSAMADELPAGEERSRFAAELAGALGGHGPYREQVDVHALIAVPARRAAARRSQRVMRRPRSR